MIRRSRLGSAALLAVLAVVLPLGGGPASAQAAKPSLSVDVPVVEVTARPGATSTDRVQIVNNGASEAEVDVLIEDVGGDARGDLVAVPRGIGQPNSAATWVTATPANLKVASSASAIIDIRIKVPVGTKAGGYYAAVTFTTDDRTPPEQRATHLLLVKIAGAAAVARARLTGLSMPGISLGGSVRFDLRLENIGTIHAIGSGTITVSDTFGNRVARLRIPPVVVLPGLERAVSIAWRSPPIAARLKATAEVSFGGPEPSRQTASGFSFVWWLAALTLAVLMLLTVALLRLTGVIGKAGRRRDAPSAMSAEAVRAAPPLRPAPRPVRPEPAKPGDKPKPRVQPPPAPGPAMTRPPVSAGPGPAPPRPPVVAGPGPAPPRPPVVAGPIAARPPRPDPSFWGPQEQDELKPVSEPEVAGEAEGSERPEPTVVEPEPARVPFVLGAPGKVPEEPKDKDAKAPAPLVLDEAEPEEEPAEEDEVQPEDELEPEPLVLEEQEGAVAPGSSRPVAVTPSPRAVPLKVNKAEPEAELVELDLHDEDEEEEIEALFTEEAEAEEIEEPWFQEPEELDEHLEEAEASEEPAEPEAVEESEEGAEESERASPIPVAPLRPAARVPRPIRVANLPPVRPSEPAPVARVERPPEPASDVPAAGGSGMALRRADVALRMITGKPGETGAILDAGLDLLYTVRNDHAVVARVESEYHDTRNKRRLGSLSLALFAVQSPAAARALLDAYGTASKVIADRIRRAILACDPTEIRGHRSVIEGLPAARRASLGL